MNMIYRGFKVNPKADQKIILDGEIIKGQWVFGYYSPVNTKKGRRSAIISGGVTGDLTVSVVPIATVGQYIGTHDKNKQRIFEGSKVMFNGEEFIVTYKDRNSRYVGVSTKNPNNFSVFDFRKCEVVGTEFDA